MPSHVVRWKMPRTLRSWMSLPEEANRQARSQSFLITAHEFHIIGKNAICSATQSPSDVKHGLRYLALNILARISSTNTMLQHITEDHFTSPQSYDRCCSSSCNGEAASISKPHRSNRWRTDIRISRGHTEHILHIIQPPRRT